MPKLNAQGQTVLTLLEADKEWIDNATYEQMFYQHRFAPPGHRYFADKDTHLYFASKIKEKADKLTHAEKVAVSKKIGWEGTYER